VVSAVPSPGLGLSVPSVSRSRETTSSAVLDALSATHTASGRFCGLISTQKTLPFGTLEDCRAEARHRLDVIAPGGGYILAPAHCIQPDTPLENVLAVYEEALKGNA